jgi:hypothetical protein
MWDRQHLSLQVSKAMSEHRRAVSDDVDQSRMEDDIDGAHFFFRRNVMPYVAAMPKPIDTI